MSNHIFDLFREDDYKHDPWGTAMAWLGAVCDVLYDADPNMVPSEVGYTPGMGGPEVPKGSAGPHRITLADIPSQTVEVWCWLHNEDADNPRDTEDLPYWGDPEFKARADVLLYTANIFHRYIDWCERAGRAY